MKIVILAESGGEVTVDRFLNKAKEVCVIAREDQPFMCLDLAYMHVLLTNGFGLNDNKKINVSFCLC